MKVNMLLLCTAVASFYFSSIGATSNIEGLLMPISCGLASLTLLVRLFMRLGGSSSDSADYDTDSSSAGLLEHSSAESFWRDKLDGLADLKRGAADLWDSAVGHFDSSDADSSDGGDFDSSSGSDSGGSSD